MAEDQQAYIRNLQQEIERQRQDKEALKAELHATALDADSPAKVVKKSILDGVPEYIQNIDALARASDSESVRLQANKLLIEWAVTDKLVTGDDEADQEFKKLLQDLTKKGKK